MTYPADPPPLTTAQPAAESPTLWLSLALGSILIHLVLFIVASIVSTQTAKVELDLEPIAIEFVDPNAAVEAAPGQAIAVSPGKPSSSTPSRTQAQPRTARSQPPASQPAEEPFTPLPPIQRKRPFVRPQPQQPKPAADPLQPQPTSPQTSQPQQPNPSNQSQERTEPGSSPSQGSLPGSASNANNGVPETTEPQSPVTSGNKITQLPSGRSVSVSVSNPRQTKFDPQQQLARPIEQQKTISIDYPDAAIAQSGHIIRLEVTLQINDQGVVMDVGEPSLLSSDSGVIKPSDLKTIAKQIFEPWRFEPAQNIRGSTLLKPPISNLIITAQIQFP